MVHMNCQAFFSPKNKPTKNLNVTHHCCNRHFKDIHTITNYMKYIFHRQEVKPGEDLSSSLKMIQQGLPTLLQVMIHVF